MPVDREFLRDLPPQPAWALSDASYPIITRRRQVLGDQTNGQPHSLGVVDTKVQTGKLTGDKGNVRTLTAVNSSPGTYNENQAPTSPSQKQPELSIHQAAHPQNLAGDRRKAVKGRSKVKTPGNTENTMGAIESTLNGVEQTFTTDEGGHLTTIQTGPQGTTITTRILHDRPSSNNLQGNFVVLRDHNNGLGDSHESHSKVQDKEVDESVDESRMEVSSNPVIVVNDNNVPGRHTQTIKAPEVNHGLLSPPPTAVTEQFPNFKNGLANNDHATLSIGADDTVSQDDFTLFEPEPEVELGVENHYTAAITSLVQGVAKFTEETLSATPQPLGRDFLHEGLSYVVSEVDTIIVDLFADGLKPAPFALEKLATSLVLIAQGGVNLVKNDFTATDLPAFADIKFDAGDLEYLDKVIITLIYQRIELGPQGLGTDLVLQRYCAENVIWLQELVSKMEKVAMDWKVWGCLDFRESRYNQDETMHFFVGARDQGKKFLKHAVHQREQGALWKKN